MPYDGEIQVVSALLGTDCQKGGLLEANSG